MLLKNLFSESVLALLIRRTKESWDIQGPINSTPIQPEMAAGILSED